MKRPKFANSHFYHVFNRGVDKRKIFMGDKDYSRFLFSLRDFNDKNYSANLHRKIKVENGRVSIGNRIPNKNVKREPLVKIHCSCLMPNHFHLILEQVADGGISKFMQKLGIGYTNYFNLRYERSGVLFQGKFKAVLIGRDEYLNYLIQYIYMNPLDLMEPGWKENGLENWKEAKKFLINYRWTDCKDFDQFDDFLRSCKVGKESSKNVFEHIKDFIIE